MTALKYRKVKRDKVRGRVLKSAKKKYVISGCSPNSKYLFVKKSDAIVKIIKESLGQILNPKFCTPFSVNLNFL